MSSRFRERLTQRIRKAESDRGGRVTQACGLDIHMHRCTLVPLPQWTHTLTHRGLGSVSSTHTHSHTHRVVYCSLLTLKVLCRYFMRCVLLCCPAWPRTLRLQWSSCLRLLRVLGLLAGAFSLAVAVLYTYQRLICFIVYIYRYMSIYNIFSHYRNDCFRLLLCEYFSKSFAHYRKSIFSWEDGSVRREHVVQALGP